MHNRWISLPARERSFILLYYCVYFAFIHLSRGIYLLDSFSNRMVSLINFSIEFLKEFLYIFVLFFFLIQIGMCKYSDTTIKCWYLPDLVNLWQISLGKFRPEIGKVFLSFSYPIFPSENWAINKIWEEICNCNASLPRQNEIVTLFLNDITYLPSIFVFLSFFFFFAPVYPTFRNNMFLKTLKHQSKHRTFRI